MNNLLQARYRSHQGNLHPLGYRRLGIGRFALAGRVLEGLAAALCMLR
jgi:hypothetical protein